jgi:hypothetical protein
LDSDGTTRKLTLRDHAIKELVSTGAGGNNGTGKR